MKILQLVPRFPIPPDDGGKISIANIFIEAAKAGHDVTMVSLNSETIDNKHIKEAEKYGKVILIEKDTRNTVFKALKYFLTNRSIYIEKNYSKKVINEIESKLDFNKFDVIHCDHTNMAKLGLELGEKYKKPVGLRLHNIEYIIWQRYYEELPKFDPRRLFLKQQYKLLKNLEGKYIARSDIAFAITDEDKVRGEEISKSNNIVTATAGVSLDYWTPSGNSSKIKNSLVIATTFHWRHNYNAIMWFIDYVLPKLRSKFEDLTFNIIGKNSPDSFNSYKNIGVRNIGYVEEIKPELEKYQIYIAPLFVGSGIRIKILEAMALELPVVATNISAEGINAGEEEGLFRANDPDSYYSAVEKLLNNDDLRIAVGKKAREFIIENHTWDKNVKIMLDEYGKLKR